MGFIAATVVGNIFSSPTPQPVYEAMKAVNGGAGVIYILGNYSGEKMNFGLAAEMARGEGIRIDSSQVTDDVASAPKGSEKRRRGIAGNFFVLKIAGAKAEEMASLEEVKEVARKANARATMGVAWHLPIQPRKPTCLGRRRGAGRDSRRARIEQRTQTP